MRNALRRQSPPWASPPALEQGENDHGNEGQVSSTTLQLALAWGFVGIPLAWGVIETISNAMKLFQ